MRRTISLRQVLDWQRPIDDSDSLEAMIRKCIDIKNRINDGREAPGEWSEFHRLAEEIKDRSGGAVEIKLWGQMGEGSVT